MKQIFVILKVNLYLKKNFYITIIINILWKIEFIFNCLWCTHVPVPTHISGFGFAPHSLQDRSLVSQSSCHASQSPSGSVWSSSQRAAFPPGDVCTSYPLGPLFLCPNPWAVECREDKNERTCSFSCILSCA